MPTVPRYDERQVDLNPLPGQRQQIAAPAAAFGAQTAKDTEQVGKILGGVADAATEFAIKEKRKVDEAAVNNVLHTASLELSAAREKVTSERGKYVGPDREKKAPLAEEYSLLAGEILDKYAMKISDPSQLEMLMVKGQDVLQREMDFAYELETKANNEYMVTTGTKVIDTAWRMAMESGGDDKLLGSAREMLRSGFRNVGAGNQWSDQVLEQKTAEAEGKVVGAVIGKLIDDGQVARANRLFGEFKKVIPVDQHEKLLKDLEEEGYTSSARVIVADAIARKLPYDQAYASIKGEGKAQDVARNMLKQRYAEEAYAKSVAQTNANNEALALVRDGKPVPRSLLNRMDPKAAIAIGSFYEKKARGEKVKTDPRVYEQVRAKVLEDETFDLTPFVDQLNEGDYQELVRLKQDSGNKQKVAFAKKVDAEIKSRAKAAGLNDEQAARYGMWVRENIAAVADEDRPLNDNDLRNIADKGLLKKKSGWYSPSRFVFMNDGEGDYVVDGGDGADAIADRYALDTPEGAATIEGRNRAIDEAYFVIPQSTRSKIEASLRRAGIVPDEANVRELYEKMKSKGLIK